LNPPIPMKRIKILDSYRNHFEDICITDARILLYQIRLIINKK